MAPDYTGAMDSPKTSTQIEHTPASSTQWLLTPLLIVLAGVALRVAQLVRWPELYLDWEELGRGLVARELLDGMALHLLDHQMDPYAGGSLVMGILAVPFFVIFGDSVVSLKLAAVPFIALTASFLYALLARSAGRGPATLAAALVFLAPYAQSRLSLLVWGDHSQVPAFMALCLLLAWSWGVEERRSSWRAGALGLTAGFGLYFHYHLAIPLLVVGLLLLATDRRGLLGRQGIAMLAGAIIGFSPWLVYNLTHDFEGLTISRYGSLVQPGLGWVARYPGRLMDLLGPVCAQAWGTAPVASTAQRIISGISWLAVVASWAGLAWADRGRVVAFLRSLVRGAPVPGADPRGWIGLLFLAYPPCFILLAAASPFDFENRPWYFADRYLTTLWLAGLVVVALAAGRLWSRPGPTRWLGVGLALWFLTTGAAAQLALLQGVAPGPLPEARDQHGELLRGYDYALLADDRVCPGWYRGDLEAPLAVLAATSGPRRTHLAKALGCSLGYHEGADPRALAATLDARLPPAHQDTRSIYEGVGVAIGTWHGREIAEAIKAMEAHAHQDSFLAGLRGSISWWHGGDGHTQSAQLILDAVPRRQQEDFLVALGQWIQQSHKGKLDESLVLVTQQLPHATRRPVLTGVCQNIAWRLSAGAPRQQAETAARAALPPDLAQHFEACLRSAWDPAPPPPADWDVIVVGAGPAGLAAALEAERAQARVLLLDGQATVGGRARWGDGEIWFAGTTTQRAYGVQDSPERAIEDWQAVTGAPPGPWAERYLQEAPVQVHDWLVDQGVEFDQLEQDTRSGVHRMHHAKGGSPALVQALLGALEAVPQTQSWVTDLVVEEGAVRGVVIRRGDAKWALAEGTEPLRAPAVVLATGSILGTNRRMQAHLDATPCAARPMFQRIGSFPDVTDVVAMVEPLGARLRSPDSVGAYAHLLAEPPWPFIAVEYGLWVNQSGTVFFDPREWTSIDSGLALTRQPECQGWIVFGDQDADRILGSIEPGMRKQALARGDSLVQAYSVEQLAAKAGIDADGLRTSLAVPNHAAQPPLWAARLGLSIGKSFGGVVTDLDGRVLDGSGQPIPGLYAAGELSGMAGGDLAAPDGMDGSLGAVILSGRAAGQAAARYRP